MRGLQFHPTVAELARVKGRAEFNRGGYSILAKVLYHVDAATLYQDYRHSGKYVGHRISE